MSGDPHAEKYEYVRRVSNWMTDNHRYPIVRMEADAGPGKGLLSLDGLYDGRSARIRTLIAQAYYRGVRKGASNAWEAKQKVELR